MEGQLAQLFFERLAFADVAEIERQPLYRRILRQVAADALEHAAPRASLNTQLHRSDRSGARGGDLGQEQAHFFTVLADPQLKKTLAGNLLGLQPERALAGG